MVPIVFNSNHNFTSWAFGFLNTLITIFLIFRLDDQKIVFKNPTRESSATFTCVPQFEFEKEMNFHLIFTSQIFNWDDQVEE